MTINEPIYGKCEIKDPLVESLIMLPEFQRLKQLNCQGIPDEYYCSKGYSRYDHSLGVFLLLRGFGASYKEQVAGLLHDISHKAFSHIYDWVIKEPTVKGDKEDEQDKLHIKYSENPKIKRLLTNAGLNPIEAFTLENFKLLDTEIPNLCVDRIDYSLRSLPIKLARQILKGLTVQKGKILCKDYIHASRYGKEFLKLQINNWGSPEAVVRYYHFSELLKGAVNARIISLTDFDSTDDWVIHKMLISGTKELIKSLKRFQESSLFQKARAGNQKTVYKKFRYIDPLFLEKDTVYKLSEFDKGFNKLLKSAMETSQNGISFSPLW